MVNILSGGHHAGHNFEFQDFLVVPRGFASYAAALEAVVAVHRTARAELEARRYTLTGVADEGGWGPLLPGNELALEILTASIARAGFEPGMQMAIAIDAAATHFLEDGRYRLRSEGRTLSSDAMIELLDGWAARYPIISIEDGLGEDDWDGWKRLTAALGSRVQLVGDDLFVTALERLERGIASGAGNAVLVLLP
jgi:enolase